MTGATRRWSSTRCRRCCASARSRSPAAEPVLGPAKPDPGKDADDCDALRTDPLFKLAMGQARESGRALCSQPTRSRLENAPSRIEVARMTTALVDLFCRSFPTPPATVTLDIDDTCNPVHGHQQLSLCRHCEHYRQARLGPGRLHRLPPVPQHCRVNHDEIPVAIAAAGQPDPRASQPAGQLPDLASCHLVSPLPNRLRPRAPFHQTPPGACRAIEFTRFPEDSPLGAALPYRRTAHSRKPYRLQCGDPRVNGGEIVCRRGDKLARQGTIVFQRRVNVGEVG